MTPSSREWLFRVVAVLLGVAVPLAAVEGLSAALVSREKRLHRPEIPAEVLAQLNREDHHIPTVPDPYLMFRIRPDIARERVQTNAWGLREGPVARTPGPDGLRVLVLGGSVAWGYEARSNEDTIPSHLEAELALRAGEVAALRGRRIEVLNGGVPAYVSWQEALLYAIHLHPLGPHWIVTLDGANDVEAAIRSGFAGAPLRYRTSRTAYLGRASLFHLLGGWLTRAARELNNADLLERWYPASVEDHGAPPPAEVGAALRGAAENLARAAAAEGARVLTVLQPLAVLPDTKPLTPFEAKIARYHDRRMPGRNRYTVESYRAMRRELSALADARPGFAWLDATDAFTATPEVTFTDSCHLTPLGRRVLARRIADGLVAALETPAPARAAVR